MDLQKNVPSEAGHQDHLTQRINAKYREVENLARSTVEAGIELGGMLTEKKHSLGHGEWLPWLRDHFEGSERHAQRFMKLYSEREKLLADATRVSHLSLRGAFKEIAASKKESRPPDKEEHGGDFNHVADLTKSLAAIRDGKGYLHKGYKTFDAYLKGEFAERAESLATILEYWGPVVDNPPPEMWGADANKAGELVERLKELSRMPAPGTCLATVGRRLREIEERELYKLMGYSTFTRFCREHLGISGKYQALFALHVELAEIHPFFDLCCWNHEAPIPEEVWNKGLFDKAAPLLEELAEMAPTGAVEG